MPRKLLEETTDSWIFDDGSVEKKPPVEDQQNMSAKDWEDIQQKPDIEEQQAVKEQMFAEQEQMNYEEEKNIEQQAMDTGNAPNVFGVNYSNRDSSHAGLARILHEMFRLGVHHDISPSAIIAQDETTAAKLESTVNKDAQDVGFYAFNIKGYNIYPATNDSGEPAGWAATKKLATDKIPAELRIVDGPITHISGDDEYEQAQTHLAIKLLKLGLELKDYDVVVDPDGSIYAERKSKDL